jgi:hypothetical protein
MIVDAIITIAVIGILSGVGLLIGVVVDKILPQLKNSLF